MKNRLFRLAVLAFLALAMNACARAHANRQTLMTRDCGVSWKLIPAGDMIPTTAAQPCSYRVTIPDFPMQGEVAFKTSFANRVMASVEVAYEYVIFDGIAFIGEARYLGKDNSEAGDESNASSQYEAAENAVIDKRIRNVASDMLLHEDIVDFSQAEFEDRLLTKVNEILADKGIRLSYLAFVPTPEEQTRLAIDMMTAMKVYESRGLRDLGEKVAAARAGATKIEVNTSTK